MAAPLKCPNPVCPFLFDPSQVPHGAVIACPRCALRFNLGPVAPAYPAYAPPPGYGPPPPPPEPAFASDLFASSADGSVETPKEVARKTGPKARPQSDAKLSKPRVQYRALKSILVAAGIVLGLSTVAFVIVGMWLYSRNNRGREETDTETKYPDLNLRFKKPAADSGWTKNDGIRMDYNAALFAYEKSPGGWIVGDARRLDHAAGPSDLRDRAMEVLDARFDNVTESDESRADTLCGQPATRFLYRASDKKTGDNVIVEIHALANKAVGIWVFAWAAEKEFDKLAADFQSVRSGLQIAKAGDANIEVPTSTKTHRSKSGLFTLKDQDGLWTKKEPPTSVDASGTLWLRGLPKSGSGKNKPSAAELVVVEVDPNGDPKEQVTDLVKKALPEGEPVIEELTGEPTGDPPVGELNPDATVTRLRVKYKNAVGSVNKLVVYAHVESAKKLVVAYAYCELKDLPYWEQRLMQIVGSLTARAK